MSYFDFFSDMSPIKVALYVGCIVMIYLLLMSYSIYLPPILIISVGIGYIVYLSQSRCIVYPQNLNNNNVTTNNQ